MLVDDEQHLLISLKDYLVYEKFDVVIAQSGEDAMSQLEKGLRPDLIVLDISMPGMGGLGFLRRISDENGQPKHPVLVLTARSKMEEFFSTVNVDGFVAKPCDEAKLVRKIREILAARATQPEHKERTRKLVLLAEDEGRAARTIGQALEDVGFEVEVVVNGPGVLERAPTIMPDLILMKEILPRLNGSAVASLVGVMPSLTRIPVVIYDETLPETADMPSRYAGVKCVRKVLRNSQPAMLVSAVEELLSR